MEELRAAVAGDAIRLEGTRVARHPQCQRRTFVQEPDQSDETYWVVLSPSEASAAVDDLLRGWPFS
jgi:hypothetical protein